MIFGFSWEAWSEWCNANGYDPANFEGTMQQIQAAPAYVCMKCEQPINFSEVYVQLEPVAPVVSAKFLHGPCFLSHVIEHGEKQDDPIMCLIYRKKV